VCRKKYSILHFLLIPVMMVVLSLPGLLAGRSVMDIISIYVDQTNTYNRVFVNFPNIYTLITNAKGAGDYQMFRKYALLLTVLMLGLGLFFCMRKKVRLTNAKVFWGVAIWSLYTCSFFLPNMHERYAYVMEVLAILYCFISAIGIPLALISNLLAAVVYSYYLFGRRAIELQPSSLISLVMYVAFSYWLYVHTFRNVEQQEK
jgi:Gpi18-like mannosyltransferase